MSDLAHPVYGRSGLSDRERMALAWGAINLVVEVEGLPEQDAADLLDLAAETGESHVVGDRNVVAMVIYGHVLVVVERWRLRAAVAAAN
jgi:hypothetical protein